MKKRKKSTHSAWAKKRVSEYEDGHHLSKFCVPYHDYMLTLANGETFTMNVGYEGDWGHVQQSFLGDAEHLEEVVGWGDDENGHITIIAVVDEETGESINVRQWAKHKVWVYVNCFSDGGCADCLALGRARPRKLNRCPCLLGMRKEARGRRHEGAGASA